MSILLAGEGRSYQRQRLLSAVSDVQSFERHRPIVVESCRRILGLCCRWELWQRRSALAKSRRL